MTQNTGENAEAVMFPQQSGLLDRAGLGNSGLLRQAGSAARLIPGEAGALEGRDQSTATAATQALRGLAVLAMLVGFFLFVPLLQGFSLSAGQGLHAGNAEAAANRLAAEEVQQLAARR